MAEKYLIFRSLLLVQLCTHREHMGAGEKPLIGFGRCEMRNQNFPEEIWRLISQAKALPKLPTGIA